MIKLHDDGVYLVNGKPCPAGSGEFEAPDKARENTVAYSIMRAHSAAGDAQNMRIKFDSLISHDITYVGIIQTARGSGLKRFPVPYAMTNCHNSLCAVGGTINEDDHVFGLSAAKKYGGIYVPANTSVIHAYAREALSFCGAMILGSDSHTRYGALGTMGVGEGGPEIVKQLLSNTYDVPAPKVVLVYLENAPKRGVGPHDVALALVKATFETGFVKNKVLEFAGPGVKSLGMDFRNGIDVMTTETTCLSSVWHTDERVAEYYRMHGRPEAYKKLEPEGVAYYDSMITIDLAKVESMIALPFHPSRAYTIHELNENAADILNMIDVDTKKKFGDKAELCLASKLTKRGIQADQGIIAGCAGGLFDNLTAAASILDGASVGADYFSLSVYPASMPMALDLTRQGVSERLMCAGAVIKPCFCGPCFGAGDVPANNGLSVRHTTRNFPNREGSKPNERQLAAVALMDARSIAATAKNGGVITAATDVDFEESKLVYHYDDTVYQKRVYNAWNAPEPETELKLGPNITDWPKQYPLGKNMLLKLCAVIHDPVTTTDELIPSGETSSYRSNPLRLAEFTLSRREPEYVGRAKAVTALEAQRREGNAPAEVARALDAVGAGAEDTALYSAIFAHKPGDGSAREQAASCQRVLGGGANICYEYATKRYRSNCINWGMIPFTIDEGEAFDYSDGDYVFVPDVREGILTGRDDYAAKVITKDGVKELTLHCSGLTQAERTVILEGCLMNYYASLNK